MLIEILLLVGLVFLLLYRYVTKQFGRWDKEGIPNINPSFPSGSHQELLTQSRHLNDCISDDYAKLGHNDFHGWYLFGKPILNINNLDQIKNVTVKDFDHFVDRNSSLLSKVTSEGGKFDQLWSKQLTNLEGEEWKDVRSAFSPIFTSGKMKGMMKYIKVIGDLLVKEIDNREQKGGEFELKDVFGKFSLDSLASCAFGVNAESFTNDKSRFVEYAARIFQNTTWDMFLTALKLVPVVKDIMKIAQVDIFKPKQTEFFKNIVMKTIAHRRKTGERKNDLIDLMLDCVKEDVKGEEADGQQQESTWDQYENDMKMQHKAKVNRVDEEVLVATAIVLLVAGYDTTGMTLSYMAFLLAQHPEIQRELQAEIDAAYEAADGEVPDYTAILNLDLLERTILETLRLKSPAGLLLRVCTKDYKFPGTNVVMRKDDMLSINVVGVHMDKRYYPEPEKFNPDNFTKEAKAKRNPYAFLAFGQGPRACIGMRFAILEAKVAMVLVLRNFTFYDARNPDKVRADPSSQLGYPKDGLWVKVKRRDELVN